jgi:excinuclease ABC subunit A
MTDQTQTHHIPTTIDIHGARVHNLKNISVKIPLNKMVGIAGVSGSGKSSLALGVLYAEGSRRYMDALSTYTRRRISQAGRADVDSVEHVPAALALRQRPGIAGVRSTFGTSTELLNYLRLLFSRLGSHVCPNGHHVPPSMNVALMKEITCPTCGAKFYGPGAEDLAFNSTGACPKCQGTGIQRTVDPSTLVPDETKSIDDGAVVVWGTLMWSLMKDICRMMGVRTNVPFNQLTAKERDIVFHGPAVKKHMLYNNKKTGTSGEMDFTYYNAIYTVENALSKVKDEHGLQRVAKYLKEEPCPACHGTRLSQAALAPTVLGINLGQATAMTLDELADWIEKVPASLPEEMHPMAESIISGMREPVQRLQQLGLGYLGLDRASSTLSTGERQRVQLSRAVRNRTTGVLYVLDEPSIGLHPSNVDGLLGVVDDLLNDGNSVVLVDHDVRVLRHADHLIEIGPKSGAEGGQVIAQGTVQQVEENPNSRIGGFLSGKTIVAPRQRSEKDEMFSQGAIRLSTGPIHTVKPLNLAIPRGKLTVVTGVSGSGKTTTILEGLVPSLQNPQHLPEHVKSLDADGIERVNLIDASPIGINIRSTISTYAGILDDLRRAFARTPDAVKRGLKPGDFSYNSGSLRCPTCDGTGQISLDVQFLPDVDIQCPDCLGHRYSPKADEVRWQPRSSAARHALDQLKASVKESDSSREHDSEQLDSHSAGPAKVATLAEDDRPGISLPELLALTVDQALRLTTDLRKAHEKLQTLHDLGLGYLTLGESSPALSGGEAQRLKLASEMKRDQKDALFVFDEPTIGLHPLDVQTLIGVLQRLIDHGATIVVIEHDLDMISNADWLVDMGPGGGTRGGTIVCAGTPEDVANCPQSVTGRYLEPVLKEQREGIERMESDLNAR